MFWREIKRPVPPGWTSVSRVWITHQNPGSAPDYEAPPLPDRNKEQHCFHNANKSDHKCPEQNQMETWVAFYQEKLKSFSRPCESCKCELWTGTRERKKRVNYGQIHAKVRSDGEWLYRTMKAHRLQYMLEKKSPDQMRDKKHVSHRCFSHLCINPDHLSHEPASVNSSRKKCQVKKRCDGHQGYENCIFCCCKARQGIAWFVFCFFFFFHFEAVIMYVHWYPLNWSFFCTAFLHPWPHLKNFCSFGSDPQPTHQKHRDSPKWQQ